MKIGVSKTNIFLIILVLLIQFFIYGCKESDRNTIAMGLNASPINLDPRYVTDAISYRISRLIYMSLVDFNESFHVIPELATWEKLSPTHYRFILGEKFREFHNGSLLTSKDVKATYQSVLDSEISSPHRASIAMIELSLIHI